MLRLTFLPCPLPPIPAPAPGTSRADLTCEGPQPVNLDVVPKAAPQTAEGGGCGQGRVEEGPCEGASCVGREGWPSASPAPVERPAKTGSLGLGQVTCDLSCLPGAYLLLPAPEAGALWISRTRGNPDLIALSFMGNRKAQHGTKGFS